MSLKIKKIEDKINALEVKGQGCKDDCADWSGKSASNPAGCSVTFSCKITCAF
ncbi:hypothetical protein D3C87_1877170 [compost metagenome]|uniref:hypothetical protein n=1 Tax=Paenibacillus graminis TaxID=189425 RepID=UPI000FB6CFB5|nr:hypothetical protein [Paenibacillus graminis]MEC0170024.1 hypothetical protein [Paenibacillus graminis]